MNNNDMPADDAFDITPMTSAHIDDVIALWQKTEGLILTDTDSAAALAMYFTRNPAMSHVAMVSREVVGAVLCGHDGRRGYLHHLAVASQCRQQGVGRALVTACIAALQDAGIRQCNLFIVDDHQSGRAFWNADDWQEWPNIRLMSKKIDAPRNER